MAHSPARTVMRCSAAGLLAAGLTVGAVSAAAAETAADPPMPAHLNIDGDLQLAPGVDLLKIDAQGARSADGTTTGTYKATVQLGSSSTPITVTGPVTCIAVDGADASLLYPISGIMGTQLPGSLENALAVQVSVHQGADDEGDMAGVSLPMPTGAFDGCAPAGTPFPFEGTIDAGVG
ncbi:hypothetical protein FO059_00990 [Tomitella fengzijianii]|uniref:Uncharacterized protein n=2 Tax=Tomitella fengzijianii TaxID=2597660 RepID=A0A516X760_9ACTN|nr:hypothetical protein FO059_00990 [Tomitella fengzijianii]